MSDPQPNSTVPPLPQQASTPDPLGRLYHMSTTAGVGVQEYVAINPTAIAALLLGFASALVIFSTVMLIVPVAGLICAVIAIVQIRRSNQTQTGMLLAIGGMLLSLALGGGRFAYDAITLTRHASDQRQIAALMHDFGDDLAAGRYQEAYQRFDDRFRQRVSFQTFQTAFDAYRKLPRYGAITSVSWNQETMDIKPQPDSDVVDALAMGFFRFQNSVGPARILMDFQKSAGTWQIDDIPDLFPSARKSQT